MKFIEVTVGMIDKKVSFKVDLINAFGPYKGGTKLIFNDNSSVIVEESYDDIRSKINAALWWESRTQINPSTDLGTTSGFDSVRETKNKRGETK